MDVIAYIDLGHEFLKFHTIVWFSKISKDKTIFTFSARFLSKSIIKKDQPSIIEREASFFIISSGKLFFDSKIGDSQFFYQVYIALLLIQLISYNFIINL